MSRFFRRSVGEKSGVVIIVRGYVGIGGGQNFANSWWCLADRKVFKDNEDQLLPIFLAFLSRVVKEIFSHFSSGHFDDIRGHIHERETQKTCPQLEKKKKINEGKWKRLKRCYYILCSN